VVILPTILNSDLVLGQNDIQLKWGNDRPITPLNSSEDREVLGYFIFPRGFGVVAFEASHLACKVVHW
jgi:hypothetical protein